MTAIFGRTIRYVLMDTVHLCQNLWLVTTALGLGCATIGGFNAERVSRLLGIDGDQ